LNLNLNYPFAAASTNAPQTGGRVNLRPTLLSAVALLVPLCLAAQQTGSITGSVTIREGNQPLAGVQVFIRNTRHGTLTDGQGRFVIANVPPGTHHVTAQHIGYSAAQNPAVIVRAGQPAVANFVLSATALPLQELVVTGVSDPIAGIKSPITVAKVTTAQLQVPTAGSALGALAGKVAGATVLRTSGRPGQGVSILLRTATASEGVTRNDPLIVVDGVILARNVGDADGTGRTNFDTDIDPADIESIEVVKGAAAASIYGSRAASGVIQITTRRGRNTPIGETRITYRSEMGKDFIGSEFPLSTHHHYRMNAGATGFVDANGVPVSWSSRTATATRIADQNYPGILYDNAGSLYRPNQFAQHNITLSQNSTNTTFFIALNRLDQNGALAGNDGYWRNLGRVSLDHRIGDKFSVALTGNHSRSWQDDVSGNPYVDGLTFPAFVNLAAKDENGRYLQQPDSSVTTENPLFVQQTRDNFGERSRTQASGTTRYSPLNWLTLDAQMSYDRADGNDQNYTPKGVPTSLTQDIPSNGLLYLASQRTTAYNGSLAATALRRFGELNLRASARTSMEREYWENLESEGRDFVVDGVRSLDAAATLFDIESQSQDIRANAYMFNLGADFKDRYVFDGLIRRDGSSLFGPQERWQTYYRAAGSYRMSQESWFNVPHIDELVFRYSIGTAGGRPTFVQQYELWNVSRTSGLTRNTAGNAQLKPHYTREQEFGVTSILFNNRLSVELVHARQFSRDQIIGLPVPTISGFNSIIGNAGGIKGHTTELTVNALNVLSSRNFALNITAVADRSHNEITEWGRACFFGHTITTSLSNHEYSCDGEHRGDFWGARFLKGSTDLPAWLQGQSAEFQVNDDGYLVWVGAGNTYRDGLAKNLWGTQLTANGIVYRWGEPILDVDPNGVAVFHKLGSSIPDLNFGLTPDIRYKNFSVYAELRGQIGGHVYNMARQALYNQLRHADLDQSSKPVEAKKTIDYYQRGLYSSNRFNEHFIEDGSYLKIGALTARYRFSRPQLARVFGPAAPQSVSLSATGRNLATFTGYSGLDPESGHALSRVEVLGYPQLRTLTMTVDITF
jgi:TonB-linked SusC/RagA family outer membrane protein